MTRGSCSWKAQPAPAPAAAMAMAAMSDRNAVAADVARRLGVAKSTAHRVLTTLASRGFIEQDSQGLYRLGLHLYDLGMLSHARNGLRHAALPVMQAVAEQTRHTVNLGVPDGGDVVFIERIESVDGVRILGHSGRRQAAHCVSSGLAIAAFNPDVDRARREAGFPPEPAYSTDPESPDFALSFGGKAYFAVGLHPNASRTARRMPFPAIVFNLHDQFTRLRAEGRYERMRAVILSRDAAQDGAPNPMLARHGTSSEARQYSGRMVGKGWVCPFAPEGNA